MEEHTKAIADLTAAIATLTAKIKDIHPVVHDLQGWRPLIEQSVEEIRSEVVRGDNSHGPDGHGVLTDLRGKSSGEIRTPRLPPATGTSDLYGEQSFAGDRGYLRMPPPPRFDFPLFDGTNPRAWRLKCEAYFPVCTLSPDTWVSCAAMYFTYGALTWLQSSQAHLHYQEWGEFAAAIRTQFGREELQNLLRQFNRLKQTGTVAEYAEKFTQIMHNLLAHHTSWDPAFLLLGRGGGHVSARRTMAVDAFLHCNGGTDNSSHGAAAAGPANKDQ
ncbi:uncharacterized protein LOC125507214 [Triticum urartu]|uniref:uncharacterized protein LOC125507214 n=1 Tax=Triticum urartu TaxID=4572 RepID=UPI002042FAB8|nr:uncharacterized protein LOC125507214 [Triticum urartu]